MGGFIREKLTPALEDGVDRISFIRELMTEDSLLEDRAYANQVIKLDIWQKKLKLALPVIQKLLGE